MGRENHQHESRNWDKGRRANPAEGVTTEGTEDPQIRELLRKKRKQRFLFLFPQHVAWGSTWPPYPWSHSCNFQVSLAICRSFYPLGKRAAFSVEEMNSRPGACGAARPLPPPLDSSGQLLNAVCLTHAHSLTSCLLIFLCKSISNRSMRQCSIGASCVTLRQLVLAGSAQVWSLFSKPWCPDSGCWNVLY